MFNFFNTNSNLRNWFWIIRKKVGIFRVLIMVFTSGLKIWGVHSSGLVRWRMCIFRRITILGMLDFFYYTCPHGWFFIFEFRGVCVWHVKTGCFYGLYMLDNGKLNYQWVLAWLAPTTWSYGLGPIGCVCSLPIK